MQLIHINTIPTRRPSTDAIVKTLSESHIKAFEL